MTLKDGTSVHGDVLFQNGGLYYVGTPSGVVKLNVNDVERIEFGPKSRS